MSDCRRTFLLTFPIKITLHYTHIENNTKRTHLREFGYHINNLNILNINWRCLEKNIFLVVYDSSMLNHAKFKHINLIIILYILNDVKTTL